MTEVAFQILREGRLREKEQTLFYRGLAAEAESQGLPELSERLNGLLADEQHHLSRLTARLLELGEEAGPVEVDPPEIPDLGKWEETARVREEGEVTWYKQVISRSKDPVTGAVLREVLESEEHHLRELGGKWMPA